VALPYLQSYNDPKIEKAYRLYLGGASQRKILGKVKDLSQRTLARYCKNDGWEAERKARAVTEEAPNVAAVAAGNSKVAAAAANPAAATPVTHPTTETRAVGMDRVLGRQQRIVGRLVEAFERDVERTLTAATADKPLSRSQIAQLTQLGNNLLAMERKAWCVPDKIETKDTTPPPADPLRNMTDDQLDRRERELEQQLAAAEGRTTPDRAGKAAQESVN
jgi:hypothetical protein